MSIAIAELNKKRLAAELYSMQLELHLIAALSHYENNASTASVNETLENVEPWVTAARDVRALYDKWAVNNG